MNTITKTYNKYTRSIARFFDIKSRLRDWLLNDSQEFIDMISDEVINQTDDIQTKVNDWIYECESLEDKVNDLEYKVDDFEENILYDIKDDAQRQVAHARDELTKNYEAVITFRMKENNNNE